MIKLLRQQTLKKYKHPVNSAKDCKVLSVLIVNSTKRKISEATLRRFFGLLSSTSSLSTYNLDTLSIFCDYKSYNEFIQNNNHDVKFSNVDSEKLKNEFQKITDFTLKGIAQKSLTNFKYTIPRADFNTKLDAFLDSEYSLLPIVAPSGYGKSLALAHWIISTKNDNTNKLYCTASHLNQIIYGKQNSAGQISVQNAVKQNIFSKKDPLNSSLLIVIDAFDEIINDEKQWQNIMDFLCQTFLKNQKKTLIKIIISARFTAWNNIILPNLQCDKNVQIHCTTQAIDPTNIIKLSISEVCSIINTNSPINNGGVVYNSLSWFVKEMIRVPINLYLFLSIYDESLDCTNITRNSLYKAYLDKFIFTSKYAESKEDIIWELLKQLEESDNKLSVNKTEFKQILPIHLKRETDYYNAYQHLLNDGFLIEERIKNKYGIFTTNIKFNNLTFYHYLSVLNIIRINNGINSRLFHEISITNKPTQWKIFVIAILFEIAYEHNDFDALSDFCELPDEILQSLDIKMSVGFCLRIENDIRDKIIMLLAKSTKGQTYYFEQFVDINYLFNNYEYRITVYLQHKQTKESILFGNNVLFTAGLLRLDHIYCDERFNVINEMGINSNIHPWPIGRKTANTILYKHFVSTEYGVDEQNLISTNRNIAYNYLGYLDFGLVEFELPVMVALSLTFRYQELFELLQDTHKQYNHSQHQENIQGIIYSNQNALPDVFLAYSSFKLGKEQPTNLVHLANEAINGYYSNTDDYQYKILILWFLCDYYFLSNNLELAQQHWEQAFELSKSADYNFYMVWLLLNHPQKEDSFVHDAKALLDGTNFDIEAFIS